MSEEETTIPAENSEQPENTLKPEVTAQPDPVTLPSNPTQRNMLHVILLIMALIPLNYVVYQSLKSSTTSGDPGHPSSSDGIANRIRTAKEAPSYDAFLALGIAYYGDHRYQEAIDAWQKGLEFNPNSDILYSNIGAAYGGMSKWQEQKTACEKALAINPNFGLARNNLNWAISELAKAGTPVNNNAANTSTGLGASPAPPANNFNALLDEGLKYYNEKNFEEAIRIWKKALELNPNSEVVYSNMGAAYGCLGKWREQVAACEKALAINPNYQLAANNLAWGKSELKKRGLTP